MKIIVSFLIASQMAFPFFALAQELSFSTLAEEETRELDQELSFTTAASAPSIFSGQALALANILNIINNNFINSDGAIFFSNFYDYLVETLDLRSFFGPASSSSCPTSPCTGGDSVTVNISNDATIENILLLQAITGGNVIEGGATSTIGTGDAYAGANLINLANNNFIDSNYLLVTLNAFGGVGGDIVFPSLTGFLNSLTENAPPATLNLTGGAEVTNDVTTETETGNNSTVGAGNSVITTGNATSTTNVFNSLNGNHVGGYNVSILFRVHGDWAGEIFGAPDGLAWLEGPDGSIYLFDTGEAASPTSDVPGTADVTGENTVLINNQISVWALTGDNQIDGAGTALISTGDAYSGVNIVNMANTNVIGQNWILAIINIFGDFNGNIAFGRPDLWVGAQATGPGEIKNGSEIDYRLTVINNGDSPSTESTLTAGYDRSYLQIIDSNLGYETNEAGELVWLLGALPAGSATEVNFRARVGGADEGTAIVTTASVAGRETDNNQEDNTDQVVITTDRPSGQSRPRPRLPKKVEAKVTEASVREVRLEATRTNFAEVIEPGEVVKQELIIFNPTQAPAEGIVVHDRLRDPSGRLVRDEVWELGTVLPREEITLAYDLQFAVSAPRGLYTLTTTFDNLTGSEAPNGYIYLMYPASAPAAITSDVPGTSDVGQPAEAAGIIEIVSTETDRFRTLGVQTAYAAGWSGGSRGPTNLTWIWLLAVFSTCLWASYDAVKKRSQ